MSSQQPLCVYIVAHGGYFDQRPISTPIPLQSTSASTSNYNTSKKQYSINNEKVQLIKYSQPGEWLHSSQLIEIRERLKKNVK